MTLPSPARPGRLAPRAVFAGGETWSPVDCVRVLYRQRTTLVWITILTILAAALVSLAQPSIYRSEASIEIQGAENASADASGAYVQTQAEMLQQDAVLEQVVRKLRLEQHSEFQRGISTRDKILRAFGREPSRDSAIQSAVQAIKNNLEIVSSRGSRIIRIVYSARDPQRAADVANTLAQTLIEQNAEARQRAAQQTRESLLRPLRDLDRQLLQSETELRAVSPAAGRAYTSLKRRVDTDREFYDALSRKLADAGVASAVAQPNIRLISPAQPAPVRYKPNLPLNLAIGTFGGLVLAIGSVMLREQTSSALHAPGDAGLYLALPELGAVPKAVNRTLSAERSSGMDLSVERAALEQPLSGVAESFRAILASMVLPNGKGDHPHLIVVTSSQPMEGKTTVVSNLGIALSEISGRVLLIDGDMRRPQLHKVFDQANSWGLSDVLNEKNAIEDLELEVLVKKTAVPHLYLLPSGAGTDNIFGLLSSGRMARLLPRFRQEFDYVLVDTPPCLEFADARILARYAEELLLVVRADYTDIKTAQAAVERLVLDGVPGMAVILNGWDPARSDIYSYGRYYGLDSNGLA